MLELYSPFWEMMDLFNDPFERKIANHGLRNIKRPHNLVNVKDSDGKVVAQRLSVVTTPFKKDDVKVQINGNTLNVICGSENIKDDENEDVIFRGISSQAYQFSLTLGNSIDKRSIKAENKDGVLTVTLPFVLEEKTPETVIDVEIM